MSPLAYVKMQRTLRLNLIAIPRYAVLLNGSFLKQKYVVKYISKCSLKRHKYMYWQITWTNIFTGFWRYVLENYLCYRHLCNIWTLHMFSFDHGTQRVFLFAIKHNEWTCPGIVISNVVADGSKFSFMIKYSHPSTSCWVHFHRKKL